MKLYNNIVLPSNWPPEYQEHTLDQPLPADYRNNWPSIVNITVGRQLFVDDFLIAGTNLKRVFHQPKLLDHPVFVPETPLEMNGGLYPCACPFSDGVFYDDTDRKFKMWYQAGWFDGVGYAESDDGIHWRRLSEIDPARGTDNVLPRKPNALRDGSAVWIDYGADDPGEKYKMMVFYRLFDHQVKHYGEMPKHFHDVPGSIPPQEKIKLFASENGIDWVDKGEAGHGGDNSTFFYNPFRKKWIFSLRTFSRLDSRIRTRGYYETDDFFRKSQWEDKEVRFWARTDIHDAPDPDLGYYTQLYNLEATPYESLMLGVFGVFMGPPNPVCEKKKTPKIIDLKLAFSRDGFHWARPTYDNFISSSREPGTWNYGYAHIANGVCLVVNNELYFYVSFFSGTSPRLGSHEYAGGSVGLARLRRDGFASLRDDGKGGFVTTKLLEFDGDRLYVNANARNGKLLAEILDEQEHVIQGYSRDDCTPLSADGTREPLTWGGRTLKPLAGRRIRIRFLLENAELYSFWITDHPEGRSRGYMAAGGPNFHLGRDMDGSDRDSGRLLGG